MKPNVREGLKTRAKLWLNQDQIKLEPGIKLEIIKNYIIKN